MTVTAILSHKRSPRRAVCVAVALLALVALPGCLGDFLTPAQIDEKLDAYAASLDADIASEDTATDTVGTEIAAPDTAADTQDGGVDGSGCTSASACDDKDPCTVDSCDKDGLCAHTAGNDGASCEDSNACTTGDHCAAGKCVSGALKVCDDKNDCTYDACQIATGCTHTNDDGAACDDDDACTVQDKCLGGACKGAPKDCGADDCTTAKCADGKCKSGDKLDGTECSDGDACTSGDACKGGLCLPAVKTSCDDKNSCTADSCDKAQGCLHALVTDPCDDGSACTAGDLCAGGTCKGGAPKVCDDGSPCTKDDCNPVDGACAVTPTTGPCSDGNACTQDDTCVAGSCKPGVGNACDDKNPCTVDTCDPVSGVCQYVTGAGVCDDGDGCTVSDKCVSGKCMGGGDKPCVDSDVCTSDSCDPALGDCVHVPITGCGNGCASDADCPASDVCNAPACLGGKCVYLPTDATCTDKDACTVGDVCAGGACKAGPVKNCDDGQVCTDDSCAQGQCTNTNNAVVCSDGNACTVGDLCATGKCAPGKGKVCDDGNPCSNDACDPVSGNCTISANTAGCDDKNPCTVGDLCQGGACVPGAAANCDDGNACTTDACDGQSGQCTSAPNAVPCSDSNACTEGDVCAGGTCTSGGAKNCDDANPCTNDTCDVKDATCGHVANAAGCSDGDACTGGDVCAAGACKPGAAKVCADGDTCTNDSCDATSGNCVFKPISGCGGNCNQSADCVDNNVCTDDSCIAGKCAFPANTAACDDGNKCTTGDACASGSCKPGTAKTCDDGNPCTDDACAAATGACVKTANSTNCDDGNACTVGDACAASACKPGAATNCSDGNLCTDDSCDSATGACKSVPNAAACSDGSACTQNDTCAGGSCKSGSAVNCDDSNGCTNDSCDVATGQCGHVANSLACSDGNPCTQGDVCGGSACKPGPQKGCSDGQICTDDSCDAQTGQCKNLPNALACDDANACTIGDKCSGGVCASGAAKNCDDSDPCTADSCNSGTAACLHAPIAGCGGNCDLDTQCADQNPCTDNKCVAGKCQFPQNAAQCDDKQACTVNDVCSGGACKGTAKSCDDGNGCTNDDCSPSSGACTHVNNTSPCSDNNPCTTSDVCAAGSCNPGSQVVCNDANPCTTDTCSASTGQCVYTNNTLACNDSNACTTADTCSGGSCVGGPAAKCDDNNICTSDSCVAATGCKNTANQSPCSDGNLCTTNDTCSGGNCVGGAAPTCNDNNGCTTDSCDPTTGCKYVANTATCSDGNACTVGDQCASSSCQAGTAKACSDGDPCTTDSCDPSSGNCVYQPIIGCGGNCATSANCNDNNPCTTDACTSGKCAFTNNTQTCNDNNACTSGDICSLGVCKGPTTLDCDDKNTCTKDSCDAAAGCTYVNATGACNDANACTTADSCVSGACVGGPAPNCDDGNACTDDACDKTAGCVYTKNTKACDDSNACTKGDTCSGGVCSGTAITCDDSNACTSDSCASAAGCIYTAVANGIPCDDANLCTIGDACASGSCQAGTQVWMELFAGDLPEKATGAGGGTFSDGSGIKAGFNTPVGIFYHGPTAALYVADTYNHAVRKITLTGDVTTVVGTGSPGYVNGSVKTAQFAYPHGVVLSDTGTMYVLDTNNSAIRKLDASGQVSTLTGGTQGLQDGALSTAKFVYPKGIAISSSNIIAVADTGNHAIRIIDIAQNSVTTLAGGSQGFADGLGAKAQFDNPSGLVFEGNGSLFVADMGNHRLRKVGPNGLVSTLAGNGTPGMVDSATLSAVQFNNPVGVAVSTWGPVFIADSYNGRIRRGGPNGVSTIAGGGSASADGPATQGVLSLPSGVAADNAGFLYVADTYYHVIRRIRDTSSACNIGGVCYTGGLWNPANPCQACQGGSSWTARAAGATCQDSDMCTVSESCTATGACAGSVNACSDGNACTDDACKSTTGACVSTAKAGSCDDGNKCTQGDSCQDGSCMAGSPTCDDKNPCTVDSCDASTGACSVTNATYGTACTPGNAAQAAGFCRAGTCTGIETTLVNNTGNTFERFTGIDALPTGNQIYVGQFGGGVTGGIVGRVYAVNTAQTPPTVSVSTTTSFEVWGPRGRFAGGGATSVGAGANDSQANQVSYAASGWAPINGPSLPASAKRILRVASMAKDANGNEIYIVGGNAEASTSAAPQSTLYRFTYNAQQQNWPSTAEMGVLASAVSLASACTGAMSDASVAGVHMLSPSEAYFALNGSSSGVGYFGYWNSNQSANATCVASAPGGVIGIYSGAERLVNLGSGAVATAVHGAGPNKVIATGISSAGKPLVYAWGGSAWAAQSPNPQPPTGQPSWTSGAYQPRAVAVGDKEALVAATLDSNGSNGNCRQIFLLHATYNNGWVWDNLMALNSVVINCDANNLGRLSVQRLYGDIASGSVFLTGSAAIDAAGTIKVGAVSVGQSAMLLRIK